MLSHGAPASPWAPHGSQGSQAVGKAEGGRCQEGGRRPESPWSNRPTFFSGACKRRKEPRDPPPPDQPGTYGKEGGSKADLMTPA